MGGDSLAAIVYVAILAALVPFGAHRLRLLWLRFRLPARAEAERWEGPLPRVTVQLPVYDEANVVERLLDAACGLDYPAHLLEIQLLDDSDDETTRIAARRIARWRSRGIDVRHVRRGTREGYKAGALAHGTAIARGEFLLVLDADFIPPAELIRLLLPPFRDEGVGAVQAAWDHLDREAGWLARAQALFLDAHFGIEHEARYRAGLFFNFNGSAGMWRRACVESAGGWQSDTLTEDVDLSYRAQLAGWRFAYRDDVRVPAELPRDLRAVEVQQDRWTQGGVQSARKLLPSIWRAPLPMRIKLEAAAHLLGHVVHPLTLLLGLALATSGWLGLYGSWLPGWVHGAALGLATLPFVLFYGTAGLLRAGRGDRGRTRPALERPDSGAGLARRIVEALVLGLGLGVPLTAAVARGLAGRRTAFERTPKRGFTTLVPYRAELPRTATLARALLGATLGGAAVQLVLAGLVEALPFTGLFALGYLAPTFESVRRPSAESVPG